MPLPRNKKITRKAALVASSGMPGFFIPIFTGVAKSLRLTANVFGAKPVATLWLGLAAMEPHHVLSARDLERARRIGWKLA